jgi:hypothetical protein
MATKKETPVVNENIMEAVNEAMVGEATGKKWYYSKTFWANIVAGALVIVQTNYGFVVPAEYQMLIMGAINMGLRKISSGPIVW